MYLLFYEFVILYSFENCKIKVNRLNKMFWVLEVRDRLICVYVNIKCFKNVFFICSFFFIVDFKKFSSVV